MIRLGSTLFFIANHSTGTALAGTVMVRFKEANKKNMPDLIVQTHKSSTHQMVR